MDNNQTNEAKRDSVKLTQAAAEENHNSQRDKPSLSKCLENHPVLFVIASIFVLAIIACIVWFTLRWLQAYLRSKGITLFSMDAGLSTWFSLFISYAGAVATVILGILTVRLTIKQDQSNDYVAISEMRLNNFHIHDLWHEYTPSSFERDQGRRFVLTFNITGLKMYYNIRSIKISWKPAGEESAEYIMLENQKVLHQSPCDTEVTAYFDEFPNCTPGNSIYYFFRLGLYRPEMMSPEERRRWLQMHIVLDYADGKTESDVYCEYLLEYNGIKAGDSYPKPVDHRVRISSCPKKHRKT